MEHIFLQIKAQNTAVENAFIRSDNAACYHSAQTILGLPGLANKTGITIRRFDFSDPQGGKGTLVFPQTLVIIIFVIQDRPIDMPQF